MPASGPATIPFRLAGHAARLTPAMLALVLLAACGEQPAPPPLPDAVPGPGLYQLPPDATPDGTFRVTIARPGRGATPGPLRGTLQTDGQSFPILLQGLGVAPPAPARVEVVGQAFGLGTTQAIIGTYQPVGTTSGAQIDLSGGLQLGNDNLVVLRLRPRQENVVLTVAPGGLTLSLLPR